MDLTYETEDTRIIVHIDDYFEWAIVVDKTSGKVYEMTVKALLQELKKISG